MSFQSIQDLISVLPEEMIEMEDKAEIGCECDIHKIIEIIKNVIEAGKDDYYVSFTLTVVVQSIHEIISLSFSDTLKTIHVDELSDLSQKKILQAVKEPSFKALLSILKDKTKLSPEIWVEQLEKDAKKIGTKNIIFRIVLILPKQVLTKSLKQQFGLQDSDIDFLVFFSNSGFVEFMAGQTCPSILRKISAGSGSILCVGGMKGELVNRHLAIIDLWELNEIFQRRRTELQGLSRFSVNESFASRSISSQIRPFVGIPDALEYGSAEIASIGSIQRKILVSLKILASILLMATNATNIEDWNQWDVHIVGSKTIEGRVSYEQGVVYVDGIDVSRYHEPLMWFYHWSFDSQDAAKLWIARKTMALQASSLLECLETIKNIQNSAEGAFHLYLDQTTSEILKAKQDFTESLQGWVEKDVDLRLRLRSVLYDSVYGGFGAIILSVLGLISQENNQTATNLILSCAPILFILYLVLALYKSEKFDGIFEDYLKQHMNQIRYYKGVLGESLILSLTDSIDEQTLRKEFISTKKTNRLLIVFLSIVSFVVWVLFLRFLINVS